MFCLLTFLASLSEKHQAQSILDDLFKIGNTPSKATEDIIGFNSEFCRQNGIQRAEYQGTKRATSNMQQNRGAHLN